MKEYYEYEHSEIEEIASKFVNHQFVTKKELKLWYEYKNAVKKAIRDTKSAYKMFSENNPQADILKDIQNQSDEATSELHWMRGIITFPLQCFCNYYLKTSVHHWYNGHNEPRLAYIMAQRVINGVNDSEAQLIREFFEESEYLNNINNFRNLTTPIQNRRWSMAWNPPTTYHPMETPMDASWIFDGQEHYIYIESTNQARYGESFWISVDCENTLHSLPVIKDFKNFDFEIGKFYKITCTDTIHFGHNKKKYIMDIKESNEEEFLEQGLTQYMERRKYK